MQQMADCNTLPSGPGQTVTYTGTAGVIANPLPPGTQYIWIWTTTAAYIKLGTAPTATAADFPLPPNWPIKVPIPTANGVNLDGTCKVSAIQASAGGSLFVAPCQY